MSANPVTVERQGVKIVNIGLPGKYDGDWTDVGHEHDQGGLAVTVLLEPVNK